MPNPVVHFEIVGPNGKKLQQYYADLFGWEVNTNNPMGYGLVDTKAGGIPGGIGVSDGPAWVTAYVAVDDLQATLDKAVSMGGKVVIPVTEVPGAVTMAMFADPEGNLVGLLKNQAQ
jgi:predicted enzyme related to lactoylglutathione lyase